MRKFILSAVFCLLFLTAASCKKYKDILYPPDENGPVVFVKVNKTDYQRTDKIYVTVYNYSNEPVFLEGCSPLTIGHEEKSEWVYQPLYLCVWEGYAKKIGPGKIYQEEFPAQGFRGVYGLAVNIHTGCLDGKPISEAGCGDYFAIYSREFTVGDN